MTWGEHGSATEHQRYLQQISPKNRSRCRCGCKTRATHTGCANGVALMSGCELHVRRWVRDGYTVAQHRLHLQQIKNDWGR
jgi:hypothetical protein